MPNIPKGQKGFMHRVQIIHDGQTESVCAGTGEKLSSVLINNGFYAEHPCGGKGLCKKCAVSVNGVTELSCQYEINSDITVILPDRADITSISGASETGSVTENTCFAFDIGTTTLALALVSIDTHSIVEVISRTNPQRIYGADIMSRIAYCKKNGAAQLHDSLITALNKMISKLCEKYRLSGIKRLYAAGNTTMLHLFFGADCSAMGTSPYTPAFLESQFVKADALGIRQVEEIISLPNISAFVGADIVAGLGFAGLPESGRCNILIDLGTNAEVVLYSEDFILCTAAAAGPCFEGANISCGMSATPGAVCSYAPDGTYSVIGGTPPIGICATGLIDIIAVLLEKGIVDKTGFMEESSFEIAEDVSVTREDIRQFQLAKSAVYSAVMSLLEYKKISFDDIEHTYIAGGFSAKINTKNAIKVGLIPSALQKKIIPLNNSSLLGTAEIACGNHLSVPIENAEYVDLSQDAVFSRLFIDNMFFEATDKQD